MRIVAAFLAFLAAGLPAATLAQPQRDPARTQVVLPLPAGTAGADRRTGERFTAADGTVLLYDAYRPARTGARPAIVFVSGASEVRDWRWYQDYGRLAAAHGFVGFVPDKRYPRGPEGLRTGLADTKAFLDHLRANAPALGIDPDRICLWLFSAGGRIAALPASADEPALACLVAYYPVLPADTAAVSAAAIPTLVVRAGRDDATLNGAIDRFAQAALAANRPLTLVNLPEAEHGFDGYNDNPASRRAIADTFRFIAAATGVVPANDERESR